MMFKKPHREIEKKHGLDDDVLKDAVNWLLNNKQDLEGVETGCAEYCRINPSIPFDVAFNMYVSCLKHPSATKSEDK
jgi:hypothetical protein